MNYQDTFLIVLILPFLTSEEKPACDPGWMPVAHLPCTALPCPATYNSPALLLMCRLALVAKLNQRLLWDNKVSRSFAPGDSWFSALYQTKDHQGMQSARSANRSTADMCQSVSQKNKTKQNTCGTTQKHNRNFTALTAFLSDFSQSKKTESDGIEK